MRKPVAPEDGQSFTERSLCGFERTPRGCDYPFATSRGQRATAHRRFPCRDAQRHYGALPQHLAAYRSHATHWRMPVAPDSTSQRKPSPPQSFAVNLCTAKSAPAMAKWAIISGSEYRFSQLIARMSHPLPERNPLGIYAATLAINIQARLHPSPRPVVFAGKTKRSLIRHQSALNNQMAPTPSKFPTPRYPPFLLPRSKRHSELASEKGLAERTAH